MTLPTHPALAEALAARGYTELTPVQSAVLESPPGEDLLVSAQTGSGKTVAYGLTLAPDLLGTALRFPRAAAPLALIIAPTRELALQVQTELAWLFAPTEARIISCVGGMDPRREARQLQEGAHIVVGTPGRLRDHLERGQLDASALKAVVLDEADEMLDLGFREDLEFILDSTPPARRTLLFSATIPKEIAGLARRFQKNAVRIDTTPKNRAHADIEYQAMEIAPNDLEHAVVNLLRFHEARATIVFCATRDSVRRFQANLVERGFGAVALSGELSQSERNHAVQSLRDGRSRVCVATDVAARGLDLPEVGLVIHADLPNDRDVLLHRSGRTGRAGRKGVSVVLAPYTRKRRAEQLLTTAGVKATWTTPPSPSDIRERDQERMLADPLLSEDPSPEDIAAGSALLEGRPPVVLAALLARLYRARLPEPEDLFERPQARAPQQPTADRPNFEDAIWFRMRIGRQQNADARWILPLICRMGHITRNDVGPIRIFDRETKFAIARTAARHFETTLKDNENQEVPIERAEGAHTERSGGPKDRPHAPRKFSKDKGFNASRKKEKRK